MRALTTGEHKTLDLRNETEILLAHRIDNLEHALSLKEGCYSPHRISFENHQLITENNQLTERIAQLEAALAAVQVPEQVLHAAKQCILWDDPECSKVLMANFIIQLAGKDGGNGT